MNKLISRRGATLPMVILFIALMTIALTAAYTLNGSESRVVDDEQERIAALALAESGRHRFLTDRAGLGFTVIPPAASEVDTIAYTDGYAIVSLTLIRPQVNQLPPLYVLRSRGVRTRALMGGTAAAEHTVAQYMYWDAAPINVLAGWTSLSGLNKNGGSGLLSGVDANLGIGGCPPGLTSVAGVAVPTSPGMTGSTTTAVGSPPIKTLGDSAATRASVDIDWPGILAGTADIVYDVVIPGQAWPSFADPNYWPTIRINGNYTLSSNGRGTLIVTGTLTQNNNSQWDGVVMVGNTVISNGNTGVHGATITGLNILAGIPVPIQDIGNGTKTYEYNSCNAARALRTQARLRAYPNTWMDNWASF